MVHDRYFYDPVAGRYTVDRYLDDLEKRYGGIDAVLIWATYPNMGIDDRNQLEMVESMPGGVEGVRQMVADFHRRGVRVLFPMMMWDEGTHQPSQPWPQALAELMKQIGADGVNGDTQDGVPLGFSLAADAIGHPLVFQPEGSPSDEALAWNVMTWGQYAFPSSPWSIATSGLRRATWSTSAIAGTVDKPTICSSPSSTALAGRAGRMSGASGTASIPAMPRPRAVSRPSNAASRHFSLALTGNRSIPCTTIGVYASRWPLGEQTVWTIVNRNRL